MSHPLIALPAQEAGTRWPVGTWPASQLVPGAALCGLLDEAFDDAGPLAKTFAIVVVKDGALLVERYAGHLEHFDRPPDPIDESTRLLSWSMAKSVLHAAVGILVGQGRLALEDPVAVPGWDAPGDPRAAITLEDLLDMRDGLDFTEDYVEAGISDVIEMLFGSGQDDVAAFAADRQLAAEPGTRFNYSSGTSNIISGIVARLLGPGRPYERFLRDELFAPCAMDSADPRFDAAGTFVASSYLYATARDFARFGLLYLRDGVFDGVRILPEGWVDHGRTVRSVDATDGALYGAHWWVDGDEWGTFSARGYEGQSITICPAFDLICVRLGKTDAERAAELLDWRRRLVATFAEGKGTQAPS